MKAISACRELVKRVKKFEELNLDWLAIESRAFSFDRPSNLASLYFPPSTEVLSSELSALSRHLVSVLLTLREHPLIRYATVGKSGICKGLATFLEEDMNKLRAKLPDWKPSEARERGVLLIVDRSLDPVAPLMHEYTYQAMVRTQCVCVCVGVCVCAVCVCVCVCVYVYDTNKLSIYEHLYTRAL